jgi:DNA-binding CsgD family transcriptional regulator
VIGFTPTESALAACLLDGLSPGDTGKAIGISTYRANLWTERLRERFHVPHRTALVRELEVLAYSETHGGLDG